MISGTHVPLAIRWPGKIKAGRIVDDFVSLQDLAPTFLEVAGLKPPAAMTGKSLLNILTSEKSGQVDSKRTRFLPAENGITGAGKTRRRLSDAGGTNKRFPVYPQSSSPTAGPLVSRSRKHSGCIW